MTKVFLSTLSCLTLVVVLLTTSSAAPVQAQVKTATPSSATGTKTASPSPGTAEKLRERIERIVEEKRDQIEGVIDELKDKKRGLVGEVQRVSAEAITIKTSKGTQILSLNSDVVLSRKGARIKLEEVAIGEWVIVIGSTKDDEFVTERILVSAASLRPTPKAVALGTITATSKTEITIEPRGQTETKTFTIAKTTKYQSLDGTALKVTDFTKDTPVLVVGQETDTGIEIKVIRALSASSPSPKASNAPR